VATNLLLEGDDLEALLIKAHSEGGPDARIVRADKYRHGGLWGFFARERFEVAVEIPEGGHSTSAGEAGGGTEAGAAFYRSTPPTGALDLSGGAAAADVALERRPWADDGYDRTAGRLLPATSGPAGPVGPAGADPATWSTPAGDSWGGSPADTWDGAGHQDGHGPAYDGLPYDGLPYDDDATYDATSYAGAAYDTSYDDAAGHDQGVDDVPEHDVPAAGTWDDAWVQTAPRDLAAEDDSPAGAATAGLLGIADRVSAAERAATRAVEAMMARSAVTLPGAELVGATLASMNSGGRGAAPLVGSGHLPARQHPDRPQPRTTGTGADHRTAAGPGRPGGMRPGRGGGFDTSDPLELLRVAAAEEDDVPHEPSLNPVRPSTSRPEFTALLDQLRDGARPPRRAPGRAEPRPDQRTAAYLDDDLAPGGDAPARLPSPRPGPGNTPARSLPPAGAPADRGPGRQGPPRPPADRTADRDPGRTDPGRTDRTDRTDRPTDRAHGTDDDTAPEAATREPSQGDPGDVRTADPRTAADRRVLRELGVPAAWTRRLRSGDRFGEVLRMLEHMPDPDIHPDAPVVAVVGPAGAVRLEAHRTAVDLAVADEPRPVVVVPATVGTERATAIARALRSGPVVIAVETDGHDSGLVLDTLTTVQAGAVIAVVDATAPLETTQRWLDALGQVDALALDGGSSVPDPAAALQLGLPVVRFDGIPVDRVTWTALLCAQLLAADQAEAAAQQGPAATGE